MINAVGAAALMTAKKIEKERPWVQECVKTCVKGETLEEFHERIIQEKFSEEFEGWILEMNKY